MKQNIYTIFLTLFFGIRIPHNLMLKFYIGLVYV